MSCPRRSEMLLIRTPDVDSVGLKAHAQTCPECGALLSTLEDTRTLLQTHEPAPLSVTRRVEMLDAIEGRRNKKRWAPSTVLWPAVAFAAGLAVALVSVDSSTTRPRLGEGRLVDAERRPIASGADIPSTEALHAETEVELDLGQARLKLAPGSAFRYYDSDADASNDPAAFQSAQRPEPKPLERLGAGVNAPAPRPTELPEARPTKRDPPPSPNDQLGALQRAQEQLRRDTDSSRQLAQDVLDRPASPEIEARALSILADAERRRGELARAADLYGRLARHPKGTSYAEEAVLQQATLYFKLERDDEARKSLEWAKERFAGGPLEVERHELLAQLFERSGERDRAIEALEAAIQAAQESGDREAERRLRKRERDLREKK